MPTITLLGSLFVFVGMIIIAFTPTERVVNVVAQPPTFGTGIAVMNADGTMATAVPVPYGEPGEILAWDREKRMYRWVAAPSPASGSD